MLLNNVDMMAVMWRVTHRMYVITPMLLWRGEGANMRASCHMDQNAALDKKQKKKQTEKPAHHMSASSPSGS